MLTGLELNRYFEQKIDKTYSNYLDATKKNRLIRDAYYRIAERKINGAVSEKEWDELSEISRIGVPFTLNNSKLYIAPLEILSAIPGVGVITLTTRIPHNLVSGDTITISSASGLNPTLNGNYTVTIVSENSFTIPYVIVSGAYIASSGQITGPKICSDYYRYKYCEAKTTTRLASVVNATNASPIIITLDKRTNLRNKNVVMVSGVVGNTAANGTFYAKRLNDFKFALYSDSDLLIPAIGNGSFILAPLGLCYLVKESSVRVIVSDEKNSIFKDATPDYPTVQMGEKLLVFNPNIEEVRLDYYRVLPFEIDVSDASLDLEAYYTPRFLYYLIDEATKEFAQASREDGQYQIMSKEVIDNP